MLAAMSLGVRFDSVLVAARTGAEWALADLYRDLHPRLLRFLQAQRPHEAEDIASEVWLAVAGGLGRFEGDEAAFRRWLYTIARRRVIDARRREARRRTVTVTNDRLAHGGSAPDSESEALGAISTREALAWVASLPPDQAEVLLLRIVAGLTPAEVAALTGKRPGTVRVLQHRALERLAETVSRIAVTA